MLLRPVLILLHRAMSASGTKRTCQLCRSMSAFGGKADNQPARTMLEPDEWDSVPGSVTGTIYRGTERISSNALLNALEYPTIPP